MSKGEGRLRAEGCRRILAAQDWCCYYCQADLFITGVEWDHMLPRCKGGGDEAENRCAACRTCNRRKGGYWTAAEYVVWLRLLAATPAGYYPCNRRGHEGDVYVPEAQYSISNNRCKACRARYDQHRWVRIGEVVNAQPRQARKLNPAQHQKLLAQEAARRNSAEGDSVNYLPSRELGRGLSSLSWWWRS